MGLALIGSLSKIIPGSYLNLLSSPLSDCKSIIDIGCGDGSFFDLIKVNDWHCEGIDAYKPALDKAIKNKIYQKVYLGDVLKVVKHLASKKKKYDGVFCSQLIEHLSKKDGEQLLYYLEKIAKKVIVIATPNEYMAQPNGYGEKGNKYQQHKSGWSVSEFKRKNYQVKGTGLKVLWSQSGPARSKILSIKLMSNLFSIICIPVVVSFPGLASGLVAVKKV